MSNRKYTEVKEGYWVYSIKVPSINKYYIGVSKTQCCDRWKKSHYKNTVLKNYFNEWDSMVKTVLIDGLSTKEEALQFEDALIQSLKMNNLCLNKQRSGLIYVSDVKGYNRERSKQYIKQRYENDAEYREQQKQRARQYYEKKKLEKQTSLPLT